MRLRTILAGLGGYGNFYLTELFGSQKERFELVAGVDPTPEKSHHHHELVAASIPLYATLEEALLKTRADVVLLSTPIQLHAEQTILALSHGCHVLCEKPLCSSMEDARRMLHAEAQYRRVVAVGYQWSFSNAIQALKKDLLQGVYGKPIRFKSLVNWIRGHHYYGRNGWAGSKTDSHGRLILDSPAANSQAHYLHNMMYLLGDSLPTSALPVRLEAETYRAYPISNFDTAALRCYTAQETEVLFYCTHVTETIRPPCFTLEAERGTVYYDETIHRFEGITRDGERRSYHSDNEDGFHKMTLFHESILNQTAVPCGIRAALGHVAVITAIEQSNPQSTPFPQPSIMTQRNEKEDRLAVLGLGPILEQCYEKNALPSEISVPWAKRGTHLHLDYHAID